MTKRINLSYDQTTNRILIQIRELRQPNPSHAIALYIDDIIYGCKDGPIQIDVPEHYEGEGLLTVSSPWVLIEDKYDNPLLRLEPEND